jgi:hypothetical protein
MIIQENFMDQSFKIDNLIDKFIKEKVSAIENPRLEHFTDFARE